MGKWADRLEKGSYAQATLPAEPAEGASAGSGGSAGPVFQMSSDPIEGGDSIEEMSLTEFARSGQFRRVHSKVLDEAIILAADNADLPDVGDTVVYRAAEARLLVGLPPEKVQAYHEVKIFFDGIIEKGDPNETQIDVTDVLPAEEGDDIAR